LRRDVETHTFYQRYNFHTTGVNALKSQVIEFETFIHKVAWLPLCRGKNISRTFIELKSTSIRSVQWTLLFS